MRLHTFVIFALLGTSIPLLQGCLEQSTAGDTQNEVDRQCAIADKIQSVYNQMEGQYAGTYNSSEVLLTLDVVRETGDGDLNLCPQPHFKGELAITPDVFVNQTNGPMSSTYQVTDGQYVGGDDLPLVVDQQGTSTDFHCQVSDQNHLDCDWFINTGNSQPASISLARVQSGQAVTSGNHFEGAYLGHNADYKKITATFRTFLEPQGGANGVPTRSIVGSFVFYPEPTAEQVKDGEDPGFANFPFTDGEYDPISKTLAIKIAGDNPIEVNCKIQSSSILDCIWIGTHGVTSYEEFFLDRAPSN